MTDYENFRAAVVNLWIDGNDTFDIGRILGVHEAKVVRAPYDWREIARKGKP